MSFPRYPNYKASGVEWLGDVPAHWAITLSKRYLSVQSGDMISATEETDEGHPIIGGNGFRAFTNKTNTVGNTLVIGRVGALCGCVHHIKDDFWASEHAFRVIEKQRLSKRFFFYVLSALQLNQFAIKTAQPLLNTTIVETQWITVPDVEEQTAIAAFLDRETAKIDGLVAEQRRLMELLKEKRQAVISHAVTKGLNPNGPMKPSGIEWLGDVPEHWEVRCIKHFFQTTSGGTPNTSRPDLYYTDETTGIPWIRSTDLNNDVVTEIPVLITELALKDTACEVLPAGTVMIAMYGGDGTVGKNGLLGRPAAINQAVCGLLPSDLVTPKFAFRFMQFYRPHWMIGAESSRKDPNINQERVRNAPFPRPPLAEQNEIVDFLDGQLGDFDTLTAEADRAISLLQERRTALISAAVTGKIDVRGLVN